MPARTLLGLVGLSNNPAASSFDNHKAPPPYSADRRTSSDSTLQLNRTESSQKEKKSKKDMEHFKRPSIVDKLAHHHSDSKKDAKRNSPQLGPTKPAELALKMESPPLIFYGPPNTSTGALMSGVITMRVAESTRFESLKMELLAKVTTKKPVAKDCPDCATKTTSLYTWTFFGEPLTLSPGKHEYPFSYLIPGHLPATAQGHLANLSYHLSAKAVTAHADVIKHQQEINIQRALQDTGERFSNRVFPPTNLTARVGLPSIIYPIGEFNVEMRMTGTTVWRANDHTRWSIRKMSWRIEESESFISPACPKHAHKVGGEGKGIQHEHTRVIGNEEMHSGWKTDYDEGNIEMEFKAGVNPALKPCCDLDSPTGHTVKHTMVLEMVIAEEYAPNKKPKQATPTGMARILKTQFNLTMSDRAGMGISWDEEQPPMYGDVPESPPGYTTQLADYAGPPLDGDMSLAH